MASTVVKTSDLLGTTKKTSVLKSIARTALLPAVAIGNAITTAIEKNIQKTIDPTYTAKRTTTAEAADTTIGKILGGATAATGAALAVATGAAGKAISTTAGKIAAPLVIGAASVSPKVTSAVISTPAFLYDKGLNIGQAVENTPNLSSDSGVTNLLIAGGIGAGLGAAGTAISNLINKNKDDVGMLISEIPSTTPAAEVLGSATSTGNAGVITPQTETLTKTSTKKRKKTRRKAPPLNVNQRVNIMLNQKIANKKYINKLVY